MRGSGLGSSRSLGPSMKLSPSLAMFKKPRSKSKKCRTSLKRPRFIGPSQCPRSLIPAQEAWTSRCMCLKRLGWAGPMYEFPEMTKPLIKKPRAWLHETCPIIFGKIPGPSSRGQSWPLLMCEKVGPRCKRPGPAHTFLHEKSPSQMWKAWAQRATQPLLA